MIKTYQILRHGKQIWRHPKEHNDLLIDPEAIKVEGDTSFVFKGILQVKKHLLHFKPKQQLLVYTSSFSLKTLRESVFHRILLTKLTTGFH